MNKRLSIVNDILPQAKGEDRSVDIEREIEESQNKTLLKKHQ